MRAGERFAIDDWAEQTESECGAVGSDLARRRFDARLERERFAAVQKRARPWIEAALTGRVVNDVVDGFVEQHKDERLEEAGERAKFEFEFSRQL